MLNSLLLILLFFHFCTSDEATNLQRLSISVSNIKPKANDYVCTSSKLPDDEQYIVGFEPGADVTMVHHLILFGCDKPYSTGQWDCKVMGGTCEGRQKILYAWARNASGLELPKNVGFKLGARVGIRSLVLQLHYGDLSSPGASERTDSSGLTLTLTKDKQPKVAGVYILVGMGSIPAHHQAFSIEGGCEFRESKTITPFAYRVHAHAHSTVISGFYKKSGSEQWSLIGSRSPQDPQAFYPALHRPTVGGGDTLAARCLYDTHEEEHNVHIGSDTTDEMCNFYIMYYTANDGSDIRIHECGISSANSPIHPPSLDSLTTAPPTSPPTTPPTSPPTSPPTTPPTTPPPTPPYSTPAVDHTVSGETPPTLEMAADWILNGLEGPRTSPILSVGLGQVSAVEVDRNGDVLVLHRGSRVWDYSSFGFDNVFKQKEKGPIQEPVILHLSSNGQILHKWGENMFYMPHGLTIDPSGNIWITDVAMHQVFKFSPGNHKEPVLKLGVPFEPGSDNRHFCKPAAVAIDHDGYFYIADGYCNHRIIKYSSSGGILQIMDKPVDGMSFRVPHSLTLLNGDTQLMVADRENGRVVIMKTSNLSQIVSVIKSSGFGDAVFAVAAPQVSNPAGYVYAVNFVREGQSGEGLTVKLNGGEIHQTWLPTKDGKKISFGMAHDIATSDDGQNVYVAEVNPHRIWKFVHHIENKFVGVVRNRTIGLNDPGSNDTATLNDSSVRVQDETNMPNDNFGDGLHDDKNVLPGVKDKQNTQSLDETPTTAFKEDEDDEEYICPSSVPPEECSTSAASSLVPSSTVRIAQVSLQAVQTPADENPPTSVKTPPTSAETSKSPTISHSTTGRPLPHEDSDNYDCPSPIPPEGCTTEGPVKATPCASASECFALFVRSHLNLILATSGLVALATIIVLVVLVLLCRRYYGCTRWRVRRGLSERAKQAKENIHSLIGPSHKGFVKVRTFDTDSEGEEDIVFQRI